MMAEPDPLDEALEFITNSKIEDHPKNTRGPSKNCKRYEGAMQLDEDNFSPNSIYNDIELKQRFRITRTLFSRIKNDHVGHNVYFLERADCTGKLGFTPEQKITSVLRMLAYGVASDAVNEYSQISETTAQETLYRFAQDILELYQEEYLRKPNKNDLKKILYDNAEWGFPCTNLHKPVITC